MNDPTQAFWDDLNHNLADPEFRAAYEKERLAMSTADLIAEARKRVTTLEVLLWRLADALEEHENDCPWKHIAEKAVAAATPRVVSTVAELDALPLGSVVVDTRGVARTKRAGNSHMGGGWTQGGNHPIRAAELADGYPMTVVHNPCRVGGTE